MKKSLFSLLAVAVLGGFHLNAQTTVATNPVGFINITVQGGSVAQPAINVISPTLTNPIAFQSTVASVSGTTITINGASFTANQFNGANGEFYVEDVAASQGGAGVLADITATGSNSVTTAQNISSLVTVGDTIVIRQHITINQFLGAQNTYGLLGSNSDATTADDILIFSGTTPSTYWYYTGTPPSLSDAGWYDVFFNPAGSVTIAPSEAVVIQRRGAGNVIITSTGAVKTGNTLFPVVAGANYLGTVSAQGLTLATSGLYNGNSGIKGSASDATTSDQVLLYSAGALNTYWYYTGTPPSLSDAGWYDVFFNPAGNVSLSPGAGMIVNRIEGGPFNWTLPAPSSF
jgi:hypothetical protein